MTMFGIPEGTEVRMVPRDTYARSGLNHTRPYVTVDFKVFGVEDLIIDPTGISSDASTPAHKSTIGGHYAERGWYGFALADPHKYPHGHPGSRWYAVLVPASEVEVN